MEKTHNRQYLKKSQITDDINLDKELVGPGVVGSDVVGPEGIAGASVVEFSR